MDLTESMAVSVSAMDAQRRRLDVIASNLANAQSTKTDQGGPYRRRDVVFHTAPVEPKFPKLLRVADFGQKANQLDGVRVAQVSEDARPGQAVYDPRHPDADAKGFVQMPNVNVMEEMVNMMSASRAYEANVQAVNAVRTMWNRALEIGR
jgi:flagellar basal-body rod protein FlgC